MQQLFKGYVETRDKKCIEKFKNRTDFKTYEQVERLDEFAGILADDTILIDVDDFEQSEKLMSMIEESDLCCRVYETTRGKHFLFLNKERKVETCKTHARLACGLSADIKLGSRNSYSILKYDGKERKIIYDALEGEEYDELPKWLTPVRSKMNFIDMEDGDGRNQSLFNYILTLQSSGFSVEEARETIRLINEYVLVEPLDEQEIETILRDESFQKPMFFKGNSFLFDKFAQFLKSNYHIIKLNGQLHMYRNGVYVEGHEEIEAEMIHHIPNLNRQKRSEVMAYLDLLVRGNSQASPANFIAFRNGVYDIETGELRDFSPDIIITNKIDYDFNPNAESEVVDRTLDKLACGDSAVRDLLEEVVGYCFYRRNELRKCFVLIGDKANGKSTYLDMIKTLLGDENTAALDLKELGERFKTAELFGKLANIGDDIGDEFIANPAVFKKLVSGDRINAERKGQNPFDFNNYSKLLFSANNIPRIKDKSGAVISRLVIIPFDARFSVEDEDYDPYIKYKLRRPENIEYLIQIGIRGLKRVLERSRFTNPERVQRELVEYEENNNPVLLFFKELDEDGILNNPTCDIYKKYTEFCVSNSFQAMANTEFSKQVKRHYDLEIITKSIKGKKKRIFVRKEQE